MGKLSTHVLDTTTGRPAAGMRVELLRVEEDGAVRPLCDIRTNTDGRADGPLLAGEELLVGEYRLRFHVGEYFAASANPHAGAFLTVVPIHFRVAHADAGYHVPLLVSPWSYSTYRGS